MGLSDRRVFWNVRRCGTIVCDEYLRVIFSGELFFGLVEINETEKNGRRSDNAFCSSTFAVSLFFLFSRFYNGIMYK